MENVQRKIFFHRAVEGCGGNVEKKVKNYFLYPGAAGRLLICRQRRAAFCFCSARGAGPKQCLFDPPKRHEKAAKGASPLGTPLTGRACAALTRNRGRRL